MNRRSFLRASAAGAAAGVSAAAAPAPARAADAKPPAVQSEDGVVVHPFKSDLMRGNPPPRDKVVTSSSHSTSHAHRVWAHQHMRELCATQAIPRGSGPVAVLERQPQNLDPMVVKDLGGQPLTVKEFLQKTWTDAFLVLHRGKILTEQYFSGMTPATPHHLWSASKSISADVVANLLQAGQLREGADIAEYLPELKKSGYAGATVRHLLDMQSGVRYDYGAEPLPTSSSEGGKHIRASGVHRKLPGEDPEGSQYEFYPTLGKAREHGSIFYYKCCDTAVLGWACERVTGRRFADLVSELIWSKLGAEHDAYTICDVRGGSVPNAGFSVTLRDLARWGQMRLFLPAPC